MDRETTAMSGTHQTQLWDERRRKEEEAAVTAEEEEEGKGGGQLSRPIHHVHFVGASAIVVY